MRHRHLITSLAIVGGLLLSSTADAATPTTSLVSGVANATLPGASDDAAVTPDGRFVVFATTAALLPEDTDGVSDVYRLDRTTGILINVLPNVAFPVSQPDVDASGSKVVYRLEISATFGGLYTSDLTTGVIRLVTFSPAVPPFPEIQPIHNGQSTEPAISDDGSTIAFRTLASDMISNDTNNRADVYTQAFGGGQFRRASVGTGGTQATGPIEGSMRPQLSANGQIVTWQSTATNLGALNGTHVYVRNTATLVTTLITTAVATEPSISGDGRFVAFTSTAALTAGDANGLADVHVIDLARSTPPITRVSGTATTLGNGASDQPSIAPDGSAVVFRTAASNLVRGDTNGVADIVSVNRTTALFIRLSVSSAGTLANGASSNPAAFNGGGAAFTTLATNLGGTDTNNATDVYASTL